MATPNVPQAIHYGNATETQRRYIEQKIDAGLAACQTALVSALLSDEFHGFNYDEVVNLYQSADEWDAKQCLTWLYEFTGEQNYKMRAEDWEGEVQRFATHEEMEPEDWEEQATEELRQAVNDQMEPAEVFEWWLVGSHYVAERLHMMGEAILDNGFGIWWGRTCTGQSISLDPTFWDMYQDAVKEIAE